VVVGGSTGQRQWQSGDRRWRDLAPWGRAECSRGNSG